MERKFILRSKTFWVNALTLAAGVAGVLQGAPALGMSPELAALLTTVVVPSINVFLRVLTKEPGTLKPVPAEVKGK